MEETHRVTFSENNEAVSKSSTEGDEINFNENKSFPDDEFLVLRSKVSQGSGKDDYFPYVPDCDPLSTNNITIPHHVIPNPLNINSPNESHVFIIANDHPITMDLMILKQMIILNLLKFKTLSLRNQSVKFNPGLMVWRFYPPRQEERIDYDETFAPVVRLEAIRIFLAYAAYMGFMDKFVRDYAGCNLDRKSTSGGCQIFGGNLVCWSAKKQSSVAMSSTEAKYVPTAGCCAQVLWIKSQLANYDVLYDKVSLHQGPHFKR
ncbi:hypothetical protein Tco_0149339 [Tanacetum coccineum]